MLAHWDVCDVLNRNELHFILLITPVFTLKIHVKMSAVKVLRQVVYDLKINQH